MAVENLERRRRSTGEQLRMVGARLGLPLREDAPRPRAASTYRAPNRHNGHWVASATRISKPGKGAVKAVVGHKKAWQHEAWDDFDDIPEIKFPIRFSGNVMGKAKWYVALVSDDPDVDPIPVTDERSGVSPDVVRMCQAEVARLKGPLGGLQEIVREMTMNLDVAGEANLVGIAQRVTPANPNANPPTPETITPEEWGIYSVDEVFAEGEDIFVSQTQNKVDKRKLDLSVDTIIRIWQRHPRYSMDADTNMRGVLSECEALILLTNEVKAEAKSHTTGGFFTLPNELGTGNDDSAEPDEGDDAAEDKLAQDLYDGVNEAIEEPASAAAVAPTIIRGPSDALKPDVLRHIPITREMSQFVESRIEQRVMRIARGMDFPVEVVEGHQNTTFSNAQQVNEDTYEKHFNPKLRFISDGLSMGYLRPNLNDDGVSPEITDRLVLWFDPADMIKQADPAASADQGLAAGAISHEAWRRVKGWSDDDAPEPIERLQNLLAHVRTIDPNLVRVILDTFGSGITFPEPSAGGTSDGQNAIAATAAPRALAAGRAPRNPGTKLAAIDRDLRTRLTAAADRTMTRALEKAGARLKSKISADAKAIVKRVSPVYVARQLGPQLVASAGITDDELLGGDAWDELEGQFMSWGANAQAQAIELVNSVVGLSGAQRDVLGVRQAADLSEAWGWLKDNLHDLAMARLYEPDPAAPLAGEFDPTSKVPTGLIRQALARAGGASGLSANGNGVYVTLNNDQPPGGIGTGETVMNALTDGGALVDAYEWTYGPALRKSPFEPHEDLDGVVFQDFDSDALATGSDDWLGAYYFPGDHDGCACDVTPLLVPPESIDEG